VSLLGADPLGVLMAEREIEIPFLFIGTEDVPILFSNLQIVQHEEQEFVITFGQYTAPLLNPDADAEEMARRAPHVAVRAVARVGMTASRFERFVGALQTNLETWKRKQG